MAMHEAEEIHAAQALYDEILRSDPSHREALHFAGIAAHQTGNNDLAISLLERSLESGSTNPDRYRNFGRVLEASGHLDRAVTCYEKAVALDPSSHAAHIRLGNALVECARPADALKKFSQALQLQPDSFDAVNGLGVALDKMGRPDQAIVCFQKAASLKPENASALNNCGVALVKLGRIDESIAYYRQALQHAPDTAEVLSNLGEALRKKKDLPAALECCRRAIALRPEVASAHINLANVYKDQGLLREAVAHYRTAIQLNPQKALAYSNLGDAFVEQNNGQEALDSYQRAIALQPSSGDAFSNMLYMYSAFQFASPQAECAVAKGWEKARLTDEERAAARARASVHTGVFSSAPRNGRPLRLGIVSAELGRHAVAVFLQPFLNELDRQRIHLTLFPTVMKHDALADHFRSIADAYIPLAGVPDVHAAERIRQERIDVLIDTTGHTSNCRLGILAHRAAPVQCSYIGYWSTTGLTEMDWYITDEKYAHGCDPHFVEKLWKLPHVAHCYNGDTSLPESGWAPDPDGTIWLGSLNRYNKIRSETLALWAKVLKALPQAKLVLEDRAAFEEETHERILGTLRAHGITDDRIVFLPCVAGNDFATHMRLYDRIDIALDTIPANSGTTAFDALWMGVPLVALEGTRVCGRMAASILKVLGKPEWVAANEDEYVAIVRNLAQDVEGRTQLRTSLRSSMQSSELCDGRGLARALEQAFEAMHDRWLAGG
jgi:predicted O-linked N-acetylglucosamine transferase (SPINDLY family)